MTEAGDELVCDLHAEREGGSGHSALKSSIVSLFAGVVLLLGGTVAVAGCINGVGNLGVAWLRNESKAVVTIAIDNPSTSPLGGRDHLVFLVPPWQTGWCPAFGYGINRGSVTITVSGDTVPFATTTTFDVTAPQTMVSALVDRDGSVHFSRGSPSEGKPCRAYPAVRPQDAALPANE